MDTMGLNSPTAISLCDKGFLLAAYSCGSICLYDKSYTTPLTVWYQKCTTAITALKWCLLYFDEGEATLKDGDKEKQQLAATGANEPRFAARICEFFAIDQAEDFQIWNLQKSKTKPAHVINFNKKHEAPAAGKLYSISTTCPDQSFFTAFSLKDFSVNMYLMNFKKGSSITKEKLSMENKKSLKLIKELPSNLASLAQLDIDFYNARTRGNTSN